MKILNTKTNNIKLLALFNVFQSPYLLFANTPLKSFDVYIYRCPMRLLNRFDVHIYRCPMRLLNRFDEYIYRCPMRFLNRFDVYIYRCPMSLVTSVLDRKEEFIE